MSLSRQVSTRRSSSEEEMLRLVWDMLFWDWQGLLTSRLYTFISVAPKLRSPSQRLMGRLSAAARVRAWSPRALHLFCLAGELS